MQKKKIDKFPLVFAIVSLVIIITYAILTIQDQIALEKAIENTTKIEISPKDTSVDKYDISGMTDEEINAMLEKVRGTLDGKE